jgi:hypothetical protein
LLRRWSVPEITNPRAILEAIRTAIDLMMTDGDTHTVSNRIEIDLRGLLGECDALRPFICENRQPAEFDWHELKALRVEVVEQRRRLKKPEDKS